MAGLSTATDVRIVVFSTIKSIEVLCISQLFTWLRAWFVSCGIRQTSDTSNGESHWVSLYLLRTPGGIGVLAAGQQAEVHGHLASQVRRNRAHSCNYISYIGLYQSILLHQSLNKWPYGRLETASHLWHQNITLAYGPWPQAEWSC